MDPYTLSGIGIGAMFLLIALHVPIGIAMAVVGFVGFAAVTGNWHAAVSLFGTETSSAFQNQDLAIIPLFLLMGSFAGHAGLSSDVYRFANALVGHRRGGLAMATIAGCAGFGAVCGSSIATAVTMGRVALPEMEQRRYSQSFATGCIAAGGTLGILIPPSTIMILYAVLTEQFVIELFIAAIIPGALAVVLYIIAIVIAVRIDPEAAPGGLRSTWRERFKVARETWAILFMVSVVTGGIYGGVFTVNEAAAVGVGLALLFAWMRGALAGKSFWDALFETACNVGMIYLIIIGSHIFTYFITLTHMPDALIALIKDLGLPPWGVIMLLMVMYLILGCIFDTVAAMVLTLPFVFPLITSMGFSPVWWGIINVMVIEIGLITPPIGMNVFVIHGLRPDIPLRTIFRGITPFVASDMVRLTLLLLFPILSLWLPSTMK